MDGIGTDESPLIVQGLKVNSVDNIKVSVLSWLRREIKHYLLSSSALGDCIAVLNNHKLPKAAHLQPYNNGDYLLEEDDDGYKVLLETKEITKGKEKTYITRPVYNKYLASLPSDFVKNILSPFIEETEKAPYGLNQEMLVEFISDIDPSEISADITNMYNFIIGKL